MSNSNHTFKSWRLNTRPVGEIKNSDLSLIEEDIPEAVGTKPALFTEAPSEKDDLKKITGVGPKLEEAMNKLGVYQFAQVASWTNDEIMWIDDSLSVKGRIERDDWVGQVSELIKG